MTASRRKEHRPEQISMKLRDQDRGSARRAPVFREGRLEHEPRDDE